MKQEIDLKNILSLIVVVALSSCAAWRTQQTEIINIYSPELKAQKTKIKTYLSVNNVSHLFNGEKVSEKSDASQNVKTLNTIKKAYEEAEVFEFVTKDKADLEIKLDIEVHGKNDMTMAILTYATLFLFPSKTTDEFRVKATFIKKGEELGTVEKYEEVTQYRQLFLIFAMPFKSPFNINNATMVDLNRAIVTEAYDEGFLKSNYATE